MVGVIVKINIFLSVIPILLLLTSVYETVVKAVLFMSTLFPILSIFLSLRSLGVIGKVSLRSLKKSQKFILVLALSLPSTILSYFIVLSAFTTAEALVAVLVSSLQISSNLLLLFLIITKHRKLKLKLILFSLLSLVVTSVLLWVVGDSLMMWYSVFVLGLGFFLLIPKLVRDQFQNMGQILQMLGTFLILVTNLGFIFIKDKIISVVLLSLTNFLISTIVSFEIKNFRTVSVVLCGWSLLLFLSSIVFWMNIPYHIIQSNIISSLVVVVPVILRWYLDRIIIRSSDILRDIDTFVRRFREYRYQELDNPKEVIPRIFNKDARYIKISILSQNQIPLYVLNKLVYKKSLSISDVMNSDRETVSFFYSNRIVLISRLSNQVSETDYLILKIPMMFSDISLSNNIQRLKDFHHIFLELERTISNFLILPLKYELEKKRELHVREIESFERVKYFLVKDMDYFVYLDKIIAYKYVEDVDRKRGYYFDVSISSDKLVGFLFFIPDMLMLSNFVLLAMKGIVKSCQTEEITQSKLEDIARNFLQERDLPLQISITSFEVSDSKIVIKPSDKVKVYSVKDNVVDSITYTTELETSQYLIISTTDIDISLIPKGVSDKKEFISSFFSNISSPDTFVAVCV
ncbi:MAG: hypothetical protein RMJ37_02725 [Spirochaetia bacterium]|nr:hypothetical protein [Spirochaetota bacterium]MDW8112242.1 hypothetical protein [Spirochaetia bacterium]